MYCSPASNQFAYRFKLYEYTNKKTELNKWYSDLKLHVFFASLNNHTNAVTFACMHVCMCVRAFVCTYSICKWVKLKSIAMS